MRSQFALRGMADCVLAFLAQSSEVLFDTQEDATFAGLYARALLLNVRPAGCAHIGDFHKSRLARFGQILEMRLGTFGKATAFRSVGATKRHNVPTALLDDCNILAKSRRCQSQCEYRKNPISPSHVSLRLEI
jgi:hypothetical protein